MFCSRIFTGVVLPETYRGKWSGIQMFTEAHATCFAYQLDVNQLYVYCLVDTSRRQLPIPLKMGGSEGGMIRLEIRIELNLIISSFASLLFY